MQGHSRALFYFNILGLAACSLFLVVAFPSEDIFALLFSFALWSLWLTLSTPLIYALVEVPVDHPKRHYAYYARASWTVLVLHQVATIAVGGIWFWGMGFFDQYAPIYTFSLLGVMAIIGLGMTTYYHRKYFGVPLDAL
ncbi:hypothetical protein [Maritalea porphyrae]|uniref:Uncharacterized protein n=1 Tax=Maritalea porphyrae TaxID=880732 RepID=A0ABQ5UM32_9HYPH|nr:hypothetical protein [Maritalea porphyrae]GLQ16353.1 hypothetical protein GCM10007879_06020 [Maritalea porphyrae]